MSNHYTQPSMVSRIGYQLLYDPLRAGYLRRLVASFGLVGNEHVLDFGSGAGSEAIYLARAVARGGHVTCLDVSAAWLAEAKRRLHSFRNVDFALGEATQVPLEPATYDLVLAHYVLHDVDRTGLPDVLAALTRCLKSDGRFVVIEPVGSHHGLSGNELVGLMAPSGLVEVGREVIHPPFGTAVRMVFRRQETA